jgi:hypothetical protein
MKRLLAFILVTSVFLVSTMPVEAAPSTIVVFSTTGIDTYGPIFSPISDPFVPNVDDPLWGSIPSPAVAVSNPAWANIQGATWISTSAIPEIAPSGNEGSWRKFHATIDITVPASARYLEGTLRY